jgi:hypothetical protein
LEEGLDLVERLGNEDLEGFFLIFFVSLFVNSSSPLRLWIGGTGAILLVDERRGAVSIGRMSLSILGLQRTKEWGGGEEREVKGREGKRVFASPSHNSQRGGSLPPLLC